MEGFVTNGFQPLPGCALVRIQGADAAAFLHGQLTQGIVGLSSDRAAPVAYCTPQGRLLANGVIWRTGDDRFVWMVSQDVAEGLIKRLRMFVLRAKVTLDLDATLRAWGVWGIDAVAATLHGTPAWTRVAIAGADWIVAPMAQAERPAAWRVADTAPDVLPDASSAAGEDAWAALRLASGWPWIWAASQDMFLPASLDMDLNGTIDFAKGCYPGQEVIARSHYRGTVKRRLACGAVPWETGAPALPPGSDLYAAGDGDGRPVGRVIESALARGRLYMAAEITLSDWPATRYAIGAPGGAVLDLGVPSQAGSD